MRLKGRISDAIRISKSVPQKLDDTYNLLLKEGNGELNRRYNSFGITRRDSTTLLLQQCSNAIGEEIAASIVQIFTHHSQESIFVRL